MRRLMLMLVLEMLCSQGVEVCTNEGRCTCFCSSCKTRRVRSMVLTEPSLAAAWRRLPPWRFMLGLVQTATMLSLMGPSVLVLSNAQTIAVISKASRKSLLTINPSIRKSRTASSVAQSNSWSETVGDAKHLKKGTWQGRTGM